MRAYYFDNLPGDQRLQHDSGRLVDLAHLRKFGVLYWTVPLDTVGGYEAEIDRIAEQQGYKNRDTINCTKEGLGDLYESKLEAFFDEWVLTTVLVVLKKNFAHTIRQTHARRRRDTVHSLWIRLL